MQPARIPSRWTASIIKWAALSAVTMAFLAVLTLTLYLLGAPSEYWITALVVTWLAKVAALSLTIVYLGWGN